MGNIVSAYIFPHPPIIIPEVGKGGEAGASNTIEAAVKAAGNIGVEKPTTIIVTTPHGPVFQDYIYMSVAPCLSGDFRKFGAGGVRLEFENNTILTNKIIEVAKSYDIPCGGLEDSVATKYRVLRDVDHGALVPLYYVKKVYQDFKLVHISIAGLPFRELYKFGMCIAQAVEESDERVVFIASGDLSHKLTDDGPYGFSESGPEFDQKLVQSLKGPNPEELLKFDEGFCESAGECGLRSFIMMFGALDGFEIKSEVYSYEGPFGVGYAVARFEPVAERNGEGILEKLERTDTEMLFKIRADEDPYVALARNTLETYVRDDRRIPVPDILPEGMMGVRAGVFVSIKKQGQLRGCIGTISPVRDSIAEEIIGNAISSGTEDPRFDPVREDELDGLIYSVDVLDTPEPVSSIEKLDVIRYGVIVRSGRRSGLLLPNLDEVDTPEKQVSIALQKAGINPNENYSMERFEVIRHK